MTRGIWMASITIDALKNNTINPNEINITSINEELKNECETCFFARRLSHAPLLLDEYDKQKFQEQFVFKMSKDLKLDLEATLELGELYQFAYKADVCSVLWIEPVGYGKFIPSNSALPSYSDDFLRNNYFAAMKNWKTNCFELTRFTVSVKQTLSLVTYFSLMQHFVYMIKTYYRHFLTSICPYNQFIELLNVPLKTYMNVRDYLGYTFSSFFSNIEHVFLKFGQPIIIGNIEYVTKRIISIYGEIRVNYHTEEMNFNKLLSYVLIDDIFDFTRAKDRVEKLNRAANEYYETVKKGLGSLDFTMLAVLDYSTNKNV